MVSSYQCGDSITPLHFPDLSIEAASILVSPCKLGGMAIIKAEFHLR
jgi:hypothetical protein